MSRQVSLGWSRPHRLIGVLVLGLVATACGNNAGSSNNAAGGGGVNDAAVQAAQATYDTLKKPPTDLLVPKGKVSKSMAGKTFYYVYLGGIPTIQQLVDFTTEADTLVGAKTVALPFKSGTDELVSRLEKAIADKPDGVYIAGAPNSQVQAQLDRLKTAGIPVVSQGNREKDDGTFGFAGYGWAYQMCSSYAAIVVADSKGTANILDMNFPQVAAISHGCVAGLKDYLAKNCPGCKLEVKDQQLADQFAGKLPQIVTGLLQARPKVRYVTWQGGNSIPGVPEAIQAAGIKDVKHVSFSGDSRNWTDIRDGKELGILELDTRYSAYRTNDLMYRLVAGDDTTEANNELFPTQFLMKDSVPDASTQKVWFLPGDYVSKFKQAWGVG